MEGGVIEMRTCITCKHCNKGNSKPEFWECRSPKKIYCNESLGAKVAISNYCDNLRQETFLGKKACGPDGDWFEPIPERESLIKRVKKLFGEKQ